MPRPLTLVKRTLSKGMVLTLKPHPDTPCEAVRRVTAEVEQPIPQHITLRFRIDGEMSRILLPEDGPRRRGDELWKHTCLEMFARDAEGPGYSEYNISPSGEWAAYRFTDYRAGMTPIAGVNMIVSRERRHARFYERYAAFELSHEDVLRSSGPVGLSAIVETIDGQRCFFALNHPEGEPDFHHPDAFCLDL